MIKDTTTQVCGGGSMCIEVPAYKVTAMKKNRNFFQKLFGLQKASTYHYRDWGRMFNEGRTLNSVVAKVVNKLK